MNHFSKLIVVLRDGRTFPLHPKYSVSFYYENAYMVRERLGWYAQTKNEYDLLKSVVSYSNSSSLSTLSKLNDALKRSDVSSVSFVVRGTRQVVILEDYDIIRFDLM
jgi:hypothetical protein